MLSSLLELGEGLTLRAFRAMSDTGICRRNTGFYSFRAKALSSHRNRLKTLYDVPHV